MAEKCHQKRSIRNVQESGNQRKAAQGERGELQWSVQRIRISSFWAQEEMRSETTWTRQLAQRSGSYSWSLKVAGGTRQSPFQWTAQAGVYECCGWGRMSAMQNTPAETEHCQGWGIGNAGVPVEHCTPQKKQNKAYVPTSGYKSSAIN